MEILMKIVIASALIDVFAICFLTIYRAWTTRGTIAMKIITSVTYVLIFMVLMTIVRISIT